MAQTSNRLLDELARLATDAVGAAQGVRREVETVARSQMERLIKDMDVATREEVEVLREMVLATRAENERLAARLTALEARTGAAEGPTRAHDGPAPAATQP
jgi:BMFP domain-containing protein YqiC